MKIKKTQPITKIFMLIAGVALLSLGCEGYSDDLGINKDIRIADGQSRTNSIASVNGSIYIGEDCRIDGDCHSVNGRIKVGKKSKVEDLNTVNGSILALSGTEINGDAISVNGNIELEETRLTGSATTVNGEIELSGSTVENDIETINGDIELQNGSTVNGDVVIKDARGFSSDRRRVKIRLSDGSIIKGRIILEDSDVRVTLYLSGNSKVLGNIDSDIKVVNE